MASILPSFSGNLHPVAVSVLLLLPLSIQPVRGQSFEVTPLFGFRYGGDFRLQPNGGGPYAVVPLSNSASYGFAVAGVALVALLASAAPAGRAASVDPSSALRAE